MIKQFKILSWTLTLVATQSIDALPSKTISTPGVPFFRNPQSIFPSGEALLSELSQNSTDQELALGFLVNKDGNEFSIDENDLVQYHQLITKIFIEKDTKIYKSMDSSTNSFYKNSTDEVFEVLQTYPNWFRIENTKKNLQGYIPQLNNKKNIQDLGAFMTLQNEMIRLLPQKESALLTTLPAKTIIPSYQLTGEWIKVLVKNQVGYIHTNSLVHLSDFAQWGYHKKLKWLPISHRENQFLISNSTNGILRLSLNEFVGFQPIEAKGITLKSIHQNSKALPLRSQVVILNKSTQTWVQSELKGHGLVWWKKNEFQNQNNISTIIENKNTYSSEEISKRQIFSVSFDKKNIEKALVSANGVFKTIDGENWIRYPLFDEKNLPVAIHPDGIWYVGTYRSLDEGKTFEPYIRWENLTQVVQKQIPSSLSQIQINKIEALPQSQVLLHVSVGGKKLKLKSHVLGNNWKLSE